MVVLQAFENGRKPLQLPGPNLRDVLLDCQVGDVAWKIVLRWKKNRM